MISKQTVIGRLARVVCLSLTLQACAACSEPSVASTKAGVDLSTRDGDPALVATILAKGVWHINKLHCPVGCPQGLKDFVNELRGREIVLQAHAFSAPFADKCAGDVTVRLQKVPASAVARFVNVGLPPTKGTLTPAQLSLPQGPVNFGAVYCHAQGSDSPVVTLLSVEPTRVLVLFEEYSLIELR